MGANAYQLELPVDVNVRATFNVEDLSLMWNMRSIIVIWFQILFKEGDDAF